jgi:uncharacterized repeat protein (TIGR01451 family)
MTILRIRNVALLALAALVVPALPGAEVSPAAAAQNPSSCASPTKVVNGGFEVPALPPGGWGSFADADVPGLQTTAPDGLFEFWGDGFQGVPAAEGGGFAELNANYVSTLYQDLPTTPGTTLRWSLQHRGRSGVDTLRVLIGAPAGPLVQAGPDLSDDNVVWGTHSGLYVVPAGQTTTRFAFESVAGGDPTFGNFLDDVSFGTAPCLIITKKVDNLADRSPAQSGDTLRYTVKVANRGGIDAQFTAVTDLLPADLSYVPGTLRVVTGPDAGPLTDAMGDDAGEVDLATGEIRVRLGNGADATTGGSIPAGTSVMFRIDARATTEIAPRAVRNTASATYVDPITASVLASTSQTASLVVAGELSATGGTVSPLPLPIALLMIAVGTVLVVRAPRTGPRRHRA